MSIALNVGLLKTIFIILNLPADIELKIHAPPFQSVKFMNDSLNEQTNSTKFHHLNESMLLPTLNKTRRSYNSDEEITSTTECPLKRLKEKVYEALKALEETNDKQENFANFNNVSKKRSLVRWKEILNNASQRLRETKKNKGIFKDIIDVIKSDISKDYQINGEFIKKILDDMDNVEKGTYRRENPLLRQKDVKAQKTTKTTSITRQGKKKGNKKKVPGRQGYDEYYNVFNDYADEPVQNNYDEPENNKGKEENHDKIVLKEKVVTKYEDDDPPTTDITTTTATTITTTNDPTTENSTTPAKKNRTGTNCSKFGESDAKHRATTKGPDPEDVAQLEQYKWSFIKDRISGYRRQEQDTTEEDEGPWNLLPKCCDCCKNSDFGCK